ncbi:MAG: rod shape-determining protein MreC [Alphaproteobacteria bacterium]|nr:rod shape-determining protein MreC [Alphaproteobacteria bacterium]
MARVLPVHLVGGGVPVLLIFLACVMLFVSALRPSMVDGVRTGASDILAPALGVIVAPLQGAAMFVRNVSGLTALQAENDRLEKENTRLREWYQAALLLEAENKSLRELLNVKPEPQHKYISARILSDAGKTFVKTILVSAGKEDGVKKGQVVLSGDGVIGRVIEAGEKTARILLITDMNSRVPILIEDSRLHAILSGTNGSRGELLHLPPDSKVNENARVITSGHGGLFPFGLPVGIVRADERGALYVEPFADFNRLVYVRIVDIPEDLNLHEGVLN